MKQLAQDAIVGGEPVWFGCDVGKQMSADLGIWDAALYDYDAVYDTDFTLDKAERLLYHETLMTHAMLFTGVDVVDGAPRRWRVENSWGDEKADRGFWTMNDSWFGEYVFEIAVRRAALPARAAGRASTRSRSCCPRGTRWARSRTDLLYGVLPGLTLLAPDPLWSGAFAATWSSASRTRATPSSRRSIVGRCPAQSSSVNSTSGNWLARCAAPVLKNSRSCAPTNSLHRHRELVRRDLVLLVLHVAGRQLHVEGPLLHREQQLTRGVVGLRPDPGLHVERGRRVDVTLLQQRVLLVPQGAKISRRLHPIHRRRQQHHPAEPLRRPTHRLQDDVPAVRRPDDRHLLADNALRLQRVEQLQQVARVGVLRPRRERSLAVPAQIDGDHSMIPPQILDLRPPHPRIGNPRVHQQHVGPSPTTS